jgi:hypothetical protein
MNASGESRELQEVLRGAGRSVHWAIRDAAVLTDELTPAVCYAIDLQFSNGRSSTNVVSPCLAAGEHMKIGTSAKGTGRRLTGFVYVRCSKDVDALRMHLDDGTVTEVRVAPSPATGEQWAMFLLEDTPAPSVIECLGRDGSVLSSESVVDPRLAHRQVIEDHRT